jgi:hypothetical protein
LGLRAELGAFYPLLVLRYLEQQQAYLACAAAAAQPPPQQQQQVAPPDPGNVSAALSALQGLLGDPQLLVDLFVNFDCDLQAANLFERTVQVSSGERGVRRRRVSSRGQQGWGWCGLVWSGLSCIVWRCLCCSAVLATVQLDMHLQASVPANHCPNPALLCCAWGVAVETCMLLLLPGAEWPGCHE